jgi:peptidoglycan/LPS O-acetylase OafA/YrhL
MTKPPIHLGSVDGLRGIAALMVVIHHLFNWSGFPEWRPFMNINVLRPLHDGWIGVNLFLILSGFCLFWPLARDPARSFRFGLFMQRRFLRIVPAYYASLILVPVALWLLRAANFWPEAAVWPKSLLDVVLHLLLLHSLTAESLRSWNSVTWSLGLEWTWYLFFPVAVWMFRKMGPLRAVATLGAITVTYLVSAWLLVGPSSRLGEEQAFAIRTLLPGRLWEFGMGMLVASWIARHTLSRRLTILSLVGVPVLLALGHAATAVDPMLPVRNVIYGLAFALVLVAATGSEENPLHRFLEASWMRKTGEWSYSLYLFHLPVVILVAGLLALTGMNSVVRFFLSLLSLPVIVLLAKWEYTAFEQPFLNARRKLTQPPSALPQLQPEPAS